MSACTINIPTELPVHLEPFVKSRLKREKQGKAHQQQFLPVADCHLSQTNKCCGQDEDDKTWSSPQDRVVSPRNGV